MRMSDGDETSLGTRQQRRSVMSNADIEVRSRSPLSLLNIVMSKVANFNVHAKSNGQKIGDESIDLLRNIKDGYHSHSLFPSSFLRRSLALSAYRRAMRSSLNECLILVP